MVWCSLFCLKSEFHDIRMADTDLLTTVPVSSRTVVYWKEIPDRKRRIDVESAYGMEPGE